MKVPIEVRSCAACFGVMVWAERIQKASSLVQARYFDSDDRVLFRSSPKRSLSQTLQWLSWSKMRRWGAWGGVSLGPPVGACRSMGTREGGMLV